MVGRYCSGDIVFEREDGLYGYVVVGHCETAGVFVARERYFVARVASFKSINLFQNMLVVGGKR